MSVEAPIKQEEVLQPYSFHPWSVGPGGTADSASFAAWAETRLKHFQQNIDELLSVQGARTIENTLRSFDNAQAELAVAGSQASLLDSVHPEKAIRDVDFTTVPKMDEALSGLLGLTAARERPTEGVVTDVIGTRGVKVKLGTEVQEIYYIGTVGLDEKHPFYAKAVEAHKAMMVGKKVLIQTDVVTQNSAGQKVAYVFLEQVDVRNLVNGRIIGDGLGKLGGFEGNGRYRMYLENLGFIASQRKMGLFAEGK